MVYNCKKCGKTVQHVNDKGLCKNCELYDKKLYTEEDFKAMEEKILYLSKVSEDVVLELSKQKLKIDACVRALNKVRNTK